jgi:tetratricopeptide (TPR) repeat protein
MRTMLAGIRHLCVVLAVLFIAFPGVIAGEAEDRARLDALFAELRVAPDQEAASVLAQQIWQIWTIPSDPRLGARMREVFDLRYMGDLNATISLLDKLVADYPTYAEGWNQRATMRYLANDYEGSLADIEKVLEFEPRHFGALSGRVLIYLAQGKRAEALRDMATALTIHPFLNERRLFPELQQEMVRI